MWDSILGHHDPSPPDSVFLSSLPCRAATAAALTSSREVARLKNRGFQTWLHIKLPEKILKILTQASHLQSLAWDVAPSVRNVSVSPGDSPLESRLCTRAQSEGSEWFPLLVHICEVPVFKVMSSVCVF